MGLQLLVFIMFVSPVVTAQLVVSIMILTAGIFPLFRQLLVITVSQ